MLNSLEFKKVFFLYFSIASLQGQERGAPVSFMTASFIIDGISVRDF